MKKLMLFAAVLLVSVSFTYAQFTPSNIDYSGGVTTLNGGVNNSELGGFKLTSIDCPGAERTRAFGINDRGDIVGNLKYPGYVAHAVLIRKGKCIPLGPDTILGSHSSNAFKINDRGDAVGNVVGDDGFSHGFLLRNGELTILDFPGANETIASGLNDAGTVVGTWNLYDSDGNIILQHGFIWKDGAFTDVTFPEAGVTWIEGINTRGDFVGGWSASIEAPNGSGFAFSKGHFTSFDIPVFPVGATQGDDINDRGCIVGQYGYYLGSHGFLKVGDAFTYIDYPDARQTTAWGINSAGQMVGNWYDSSGVGHAWLSKPNNRCVGAPDDMIACWPGDGNAMDIVSGANGVTKGAGYAMAAVNKGFAFDGVDDYVDVPDPLSLPEITTAVTVAAWVNPQLSPTGEGWVFALRDPMITEGISLNVNNDGYLATTLQGNSPVVSASWDPVIKYDGHWKHVAMTADTTTGRVTLFLNGVIVLDDYPGLTGQFPRVPHLFFGQRQTSDTAEGLGGALYYRGLIDEIQLFNRALSPSEIRTIYQAGENGVCKNGQR